MERPECSREENIVRAITEAHWDKKNSRVSSSLFTGANTSISRLKISPLNELFLVFDSDFKSKVLSAGEINVSKLQDIGTNYNPPKEITVEIAPTPTNPAHAEIPQKLSKGLSKKIRNELIIHPKSCKVKLHSAIRTLFK